MLGAARQFAFGPYQQRLELFTIRDRWARDRTVPVIFRGSTEEEDLEIMTQ